MPDLICDVAIIGAGTAGLAAERSARRNGARTLLIDESFGGTTCASVGCMPSKLLIAAGEAAHAVRGAATFGISATPAIDGAAVMDRVRRERAKFVEGVRASIAKLPSHVKIQARARFIDATTLALDDGRTVKARAVVVATGSSPNVPKAYDAARDRVLTNETIFELPTLPRSVGVIGAGPLGLELAQALARLGVETMVFDQGETLGGLKDQAVARALHRILAAEMPITLGVTLDARPDGDGVMLSWTGKATGSHRFEYLLVSTGRTPRLKGLGLETTGLARDAQGTPVFERTTMQCGTSGIFIAGDADRDRPVLHEASAEGTIAGRNAASFPTVAPGKRSVPFAVMFTAPSVAVIGTIPEGGDGDETVVIGEASYDDQGRAKVLACNAGLVRFYADRKDGRLTGATMAGPAVEHSAHLIAWAIQSGWTATETLDMPIYHPTFEEGFKPALRSICHAVHAPTPPDRDDGFLPGT